MNDMYWMKRSEGDAKDIARLQKQRQVAMDALIEIRDMLATHLAPKVASQAIYKIHKIK